MNDLINIGNIYIASTTIIVLIGAISFKTLKRSLPLRVLFYLILTSLITDCVSTIMQIKGIHNIWVLNLYSLIEYSLFAIFYLVLFRLNRNWKWIVVLTYVIALTIMVSTTIAQSFSEHLNSALMGIKSIILICSAVYYFKIMLDEIEYDTPWSNPFFWINSGVLIYFSGCFFIFIFSEYRDVARTINLWDIHNIIHIIYNLLILIGFWKARKV